MLRLRVTRLKEICRSWLVCVAVYTIDPCNELIVTEYSEELVPTAQVLIKSYRQNPDSICVVLNDAGSNAPSLNDALIVSSANFVSISSLETILNLP